MRQSLRLLLVGTVLAQALTLGCGPIVLFPGGQLAGQVHPTPDDWGFLAEISTIQLESRPSDPYSVNIWITEIGSSLYLHAGAKRANWVEHIEADPRVRVRVEDKIFELRGTRVEDEAEFALFANAYEEKFSIRPRNENVDEVYLIRLEAR